MMPWADRHPSWVGPCQNVVIMEVKGVEAGDMMSDDGLVHMNGAFGRPVVPLVKCSSAMSSAKSTEWQIGRWRWP
jgi:hypothetical protein